MNVRRPQVFAEVNLPEEHLPVTVAMSLQSTFAREAPFGSTIVEDDEIHCKKGEGESHEN